MSRIAFVDLAAVHDELGDEMERAALDVVRSQGFIGGAPVAEFERGFAEQLGAAHAVGVANGTDALTLALTALGIGAGDEVLVPANTFIATADAVVAAGAARASSTSTRTAGCRPRPAAPRAVTAATRRSSRSTYTAGPAT